MLIFLNHSTGKIICTENKKDIPHVGLCTTGWERIYPELFKKLIDSNHQIPGWNYPMIKLAKKVRENPENKDYILPIVDTESTD